MTLPIVLASTSPFRRALLERLGLPHTAMKPDFDESDRPGLGAEETALTFAEGKAASLRAKYPRALIIGSDQTLSVDGTSPRKPTNRQELVDQLSLLAGKTHALHTAIAIMDTADERVAKELTTVRLTMRNLSAADIEHYIALDDPQGCLGGYAFEKRGVALFSHIEGADDSAIVGLPLMSLTRCLEELGVSLLERVARDQSP